VIHLASRRAVNADILASLTSARFADPAVKNRTERATTILSS